MDKPRIGWLRHYFLPPSETFIFNSINSLDRYHCEVFAMARRAEEKFPREGVTALRSLSWGKLEAALYRGTTYSPRFFRWAKTQKLLHAHMGYTGVHGLWAASRFGLPLVTSFYGNDCVVLQSAQRYKPEYWHFWALAKRLFARGDRFLVLSKDMQKQLVAIGCPEEKIRVNGLGIDLARFALPRVEPARGEDSPLRVLMVGREVQKKGFDDGIRACAAAVDRGARVDLTILGTDGPLKSELVALSEELRLPVQWPDPSTRVPKAMAASDVLLVPSRTADNGDREGTPTVICEGSAAGLPIVATRHAGIPEQVEDETTGLLSNERDVGGLAASLNTLSANRQLRQQMGEAARAKAQRDFSLASHRDRLQATYDELLGEG